MPDFGAMSDDELLSLLRTEEDRLPAAAAKEIVRRGDQLEDRLIDLLNEDELWEDEEKAWWALPHAVRLLAICGRPDSFDFVLAAIERAYDEELDWIWMDAREFLAAYGPRLSDALADAVRSHGDADGDEIAADCLEALAIQTAHGEYPLEKLLGLVAEVKEREERSMELEERTDRILSLWIHADQGDAVAKALGVNLKSAQGLYHILWRDARLFVEKPNEWFRKPDLWRFYAADAIAARAQLQAQANESEESELQDFQERHGFADDAEEIDRRREADVPPPPLRADQKPGRNEPCSCGSGKKFKKCCEGKK